MSAFRAGGVSGRLSRSAHPGPRKPARETITDDDHHRLVARGRASAPASRHPLAERGDEGAVGGDDIPGNGEKHDQRITGSGC